MERNLKDRARQQLERLISQLSDLELIKGELGADEYDEAKTETLDQLEEFEKSLQKLNCGEVTLNFTTRAILDETFKTPEIIKLFLSKRSEGLRQKLQEIGRDLTIGKMDDKSYEEQKLEILRALMQLGAENLSKEEINFLITKSGKANMEDFLSVSNDFGQVQNASKLLKK